MFKYYFFKVGLWFVKTFCLWATMTGSTMCTCYLGYIISLAHSIQNTTMVIKHLMALQSFKLYAIAVKKTNKDLNYVSEQKAY